MGIVRLLFYAVLIWLLYKLVKGLKGPRIGGRASPDRDTRLQGGDLVQDPRCGVYIPKETAVPGPGGQYFCSPECRDAHGTEGK